MTDHHNARLQAILSIADTTSMRGAGISLRDALKATGYAKYRSRFSAADLRPIVVADPALVEQWLSYSEDKRTNGGWYIKRDGKIGRVLQPTTERQIATIHDAVAEYVILELDFWAQLSPQSNLNFWSLRRILATIASVPWAYLAWSGYDLCYGPHVQAVPGYPNQAQLHLYILIPAIGLTASIALLALANKIPIWLEWIVFSIQFLALVPVLAMWSGGI
jgi:hypothetical protein